MTSAFDYFVVFADMRTGSNFLEANLNAMPHVACHGEAFNPHFIGYPNKTEILGVSLEQRTQDPMQLINVIRAEDGVLRGFRFFHDHDLRALDFVLSDPRCAKIILTRNPVDSYVSLKIARSTGQWKLTDVRRRKDGGKVHFDGAEFRQHVEDLQSFQLRLMQSLQRSGQTAFYVAYEDLQDLRVMNGLARYLGVPEDLEALDSSLKRQNPSPVSEKVSNFSDVSAALAELDRFNLTRTPNFEPRRGAAVPTYVTADQAPLLYMPIRSGPEAEVLNWLAAFDDGAPDDLPRKHNQKSLRQWRRNNEGNRSFTVVRHPVARAHHAFCERILSKSPGSYTQIHKTLRKVYKLPLPPQGVFKDYDAVGHRAAFVAFLEFLRANLAGQTSIRIDAHWASQSEILRGFADLAVPDMIIREEEMESYLPALAMQVGRMDAPEPQVAPEDLPYGLATIYDAEIETLVRDIYPRDYLNFGFSDWA
ncbi:sulfotransferase family 2 domain-containing protein [uncultured Shimia sp.]|uniref:sulfotransferase family 2 domain-containing protein n=1 Tax=uncultured Shimia sp. TaxID=573152 RepID=UPI0026191687|nr:sulfotransferase family 2 domain-containing protein [uncultured Shimia sp.]